MENQLAYGLNANIIFDTYININDIKMTLIILIVATGDEVIPKEIGYGPPHLMHVHGLL